MQLVTSLLFGVISNPGPSLSVSLYRSLSPSLSLSLSPSLSLCLSVRIAFFVSAAPSMLIIVRRNVLPMTLTVVVKELTGC